MGVIQVQGPRYGRTYSVNISGDQPTPEEQQRIEQFLVQKELGVDQFIQSRFGGTQGEDPLAEPEEQDKTAFMRGFESQPFQRERSFGVVQEALADTGLGRFLGFDAEEARAKQEAAEAELARLEAEDASVGFRDIEGVGTAASFAGEQIGSEAKDIAIQTVGTLFGPLGRAAATGYTTAMAAPELLAEAIEKQREAGGELNLRNAIGATAANMASEFVADYFIVGKLLKPVDAGAFKRTLVEGGKGAGVEGAQEVSQTMVNRLQAGLPLDSQDALMEYAEAFAGGASVGGPFAGGAAALAGRDTQLDDDLNELANEGILGSGFVDRFEKEAADRRPLALPAPERPEPILEIGAESPSMALPSPESFPPAPDDFEGKPFTRDQYETVSNLVKQDVEAGKNINITRMHQQLRKSNPEMKVKDAKQLVEQQIIPEMKARGAVIENRAGGPKLLPPIATDQATGTRYKGLKSDINKATRTIKAEERKIDTIKQHLETLAQYGRDLNGNRDTDNEFNAELAKSESNILQQQKKIEAAQDRLRSIGEDTYVPNIESVGLPSNLKAVPVPEATEQALQPRYEAKKEPIKGLQSQLSGVGRQIKKLNDTAKKRQLSSIELDRMSKLQQAQSDVSVRLGEAQADLKAPSKIIQEAKGEQFREQERQRELARKKEAARARAVNDKAQKAQSQGQTPFTFEFTEAQDRVFSALQDRLNKLGFRDINLQRQQGLIDDVAEGAYDPTTRAITLSMGMYDPKLSDQEYFDKLSEVMNHELVHAAKDLGVFDGKEYSSLEKATSGLKYVKKTPDGNAQRRYSYLDRAKRINSRLPEGQRLNDAQVKEEAIAEMFRDYNAGRLKLAGRPKSTMERIKRFFKGLVGTLNDQGFSTVDSIFGGLNAGDMGARSRTQPNAFNSDVKYSRIPRDSSASNLQSFIRGNPDGYTISPETFEFVEGGYVVAPVKEAEIITGQDLPEEVLVDYLRDNKDIAKILNRPVFLGGWFNNDDQQYYLDSAIITPSKEEALYIANGAEQIAIFDLNNFEEINTSDGIRELQQSGAYSGDTAIGYRIRSKEIGRRFEEARLQRIASEAEQLAEESGKPLYSRVIPLSQEQRRASILDYLDPDTGKPRFKSPAGSMTLVNFAQKLRGLRGTRRYDVVDSAEDRETVARIMAAEAEAALLSSSDAIGWYDEKLKLAKKILYPLYPEVSPVKPDGTENPLHDPASENAFDFATAITSNGLSVIDNYLFTSRQYDAWKNSADGKFPVQGSGAQGGSMLQAFEFWNTLVDQGMDSNQIGDFLMREMPRGELNNALKEVYGVDRIADLPITAGDSELATENVGVAYILGPKIGNGFYRNLRGNFNPLTMDRWWMRFFNRVTGNPVAEYNPELLQTNKDTLWNLMSNPSSLEAIDQKLLQATLDKVGIVTLEKSDIELLAPEIVKVWNKDFFNKAYKDKVAELEGQYDFEVVRGTVRGKDAEVVKKLAQAARPSSTALSRGAKNLSDKLKVTLQEDPRGAPDRAAMRASAVRAREILRDELGVDINNADFQALMWYAEKRIFEAGGVRKGRGDDNDYADGAIAILREKGVPDAKIEATLPDTERGRLNSVKPQLATDAEVGTTTDTIPKEPVEGDFFAPRELTILESDQAQQENLSPQDLIDTQEALEGVEIDQEPPRQMYSRVIPAQALMPVQAPVKLKDGSPNPVYGYFMDRGKLRPIVLPKGSHRTFESGVEVGQGLFHIQQRAHDKELVENSKYKRVENAIYDLLRRWQDQGYDDGEDVISYPSQGGIVLEWRNNLAFSAPPMRLVLESGRDLPNAPAKDAFYVKTFFPVLEKKNRAKPVQRGRQALNNVRADNRRMYSRLMSSTAQPKSTPTIGADDLERRIRDIRYTGTQDAVANVFSKLGKPFGVEKESVKDSVDYVFRKLQDQFAPVGALYDKLRKNGADIARDMDTYFQELAMHGITGEKKTRFVEDEFNPMIEEVARMNLSSTDDAALNKISGYYRQIKDKNENSSYALANAYLYAKHALERNARIRKLSKGQIEKGSGMSDKEANDIIAFVNGMNQMQRNVMERTLAASKNIIDITNDTYIEGGLIPDYKDGVDVDDDTKEAFTQYSFYVPLRGFADPEESLDIAEYGAGGASGQKFGAGSKQNKSALGRSSYAGDIINNIGVQRQAAIDKAEKNKVGQSFLRLLESDDPDINKDDIPAYVLERHPLRRVMRNGRISHMPDRNFNDPNEPILAVRRGGEEILIGFDDPRLATALKGTSVGQANKFLGALHSLTRTYANLLTSWNPAFILSNLPRDIETAAFNAQQYGMKGTSKDIIKNMKPAFQAVLKSVNGKEADPYWANRYKEFKENGGANALNQMANEIENSKDIKRTIDKIVDADAKGNKALTKKLWTESKRRGGSVIGYVEALNTAAENSVRLSFFDKMVLELEGQGVPKERALKEAAVAARQLTTNFAKGGELKYGMNSLYLFFNASLQGSMAMVNSLINNKRGRQLVMSVVGMGFFMDWMNALTSGDEDDDGTVDYDDLGEYKLAHSIVLPDLNGDGTFVTIPLAYGVNMFYNFGRSLANLTRGASGFNNTYTPTQAAMSSLGPVVETINPFGGNSALTFLSPTVGDPVVELLTNKNFMDSPIYKELSPYEQYKSRSSLHWSTTSPVAVGIAKFINDYIGGGDDVIPGTVAGMRVDINPDALEHIFDFMLGGAGKFVLQMGETAGRVPEIMGEGFNKDMVRRTPIVNKAFTAVTNKDRAGSFYEKRDDILAISSSYSDAVDDGDRARIVRLREKYPQELRLMRPIKAINNQIRKLNKLKREVRSNARISDDKRRDAIKKIDDRISLLVSRGNILMQDI